MQLFEKRRDVGRGVFNGWGGCVFHSRYFPQNGELGKPPRPP